MPKKEPSAQFLTVNVFGPPRSGKTTVAALLADALRQRGISTIHHHDGDAPPAYEADRRLRERGERGSLFVQVFESQPLKPVAIKRETPAEAVRSALRGSIRTSIVAVLRSYPRHDMQAVLKSIGPAATAFAEEIRALIRESLRPEKPTRIRGVRHLATVGAMPSVKQKKAGHR